MSTVVWRPAIEGSWFPEQKDSLERLCRKCERRSISRTGEVLRTGALGFVVPHAAPEYSGTVAMAVYRMLREQRTRRVVLLGFSHWHSHAGLQVPAVSSYATALGETHVDTGAVERLRAALPFLRTTPAQGASDHSIEVQIPLLQHALPEASLVPLYLGTLNDEERNLAAQALAALLADGETALVASSDLTHYGRDFRYLPFPVDEDTPAKLRALDREVLDAAGSLDEAMFQAVLSRTQATVCGHSPIRLLQRSLNLAGAADELFPETLDYETSGDVTGDWKHSVSYGALAFFPSRAWTLNERDRAVLLDAARRTLNRYQVTGAHRPVAPVDGSRALQLPAACFVSLHREGKLRGCIGTRSAQEPLGRAVPDMTLASATGDPRMAPVEAFEEGIEIEISVLTPLKRIASAEQFLVGEHGVYLENGEHNAILLPQVAGHYGLDREHFLSELSRKAGLDRNAWLDPDTRLSVFRAQVFADVGAKDKMAAPPPCAADSP
jgi:AmmeMemoRadiSam system protein B/AmmeMemoRadiSam system protein A